MASNVLADADNDTVPTHLHIRIDTQIHYALIDSSADVTILPSSVVIEFDLEHSDTKVTAANETSIRILGKITLTACVEEHPISIKAVVSDQVTEILLRQLFIKLNNAIQH